MNINAHSTSHITGGGGGAVDEPSPLNPIKCAIAAIAPVNASWGNARVTPLAGRLLVPMSVQADGSKSFELDEVSKLCEKLGVTVERIDSTTFPQDLFDGDKSGLKIITLPNIQPEIFNLYFGLITKFSRNSIDFLMKDKYLNKRFCVEYENPNISSSQTDLDLFLSQIFSKDALKNKTKSLVAGGNIVKIINEEGAKVLAVGDYSVQVAFMQYACKNILFQDIEKKYNMFKEKFILSLRKMYNLKGKDHVLILPQDSYHLDLSMCTPKKGVVFLNTYQPYLTQEGVKELERLHTVSQRKTTELTPHVGSQTYNPLPVKEVLRILELKQQVLDNVKKELSQAKVRVVRTPGALAIAAKVEDGYSSEYFRLFNFFNGISIVDSKGKPHFMCYSTYEELDNLRLSFAKALTDEGIQFHCIGKNPIQNHIYLHLSGAGLHCFTTIATLEEDKKLKKMGTLAFEQGDFASAKKLYLQSHTINARGYECLSNAALMAIKEGSYQEALDLLNQVPTTGIDKKLLSKNLQRRKACEKKLSVIS